MMRDAVYVPSTSPPTDEEIYERICTSIVEHDLPPATKLPEDTLADAFGVSRTRVRKVLQQLAHEGLVLLERHRGASVAWPSAQEARDVFDVRRMLEVAAVARLTRGLSSGELGRLTRHLADEREAYARGDRRAAIRLSGQFHLELTGLADNATLQAILRQLISRTSLIIAVHAPSGGPICLCDEHAELIELVRDGRLAEASAAMSRHLSHIESSLRLVGGGANAVDLKAVLSRPTRALRGASCE